MTRGELDSPTLANVQAVVRENVSGHVDGDRHERGKQTLLATLGQKHARSPRKQRRVLALGLVLLSAAAAAGGVALVSAKRAERLSYDVAGGSLSESGYVKSSGPNGARLSFSDGTRIDLQDAARARIAAVDAHGARLAIENGHATLSISRLPRATWYVDAGPFVVQSGPAELDVDWSSYDDALTVDLREGNLLVSGPQAPSGIILRAGQRLSAHEGRLSIEALETGAAAEPAAPGESGSEPPAVAPEATVKPSARP